MLDHLLDFGFPLITQKFVLESMVKPPNLSEKLGGVFMGTTASNKSGELVLEKYVEAVADFKDFSK